MLFFEDQLTEDISEDRFVSRKKRCHWVNSITPKRGYLDYGVSDSQFTVVVFRTLCHLPGRRGVDQKLVHSDEGYGRQP